MLFSIFWSIEAQEVKKGGKIFLKTWFKPKFHTCSNLLNEILGKKKKKKEQDSDSKSVYLTYYLLNFIFKF